MAIDPSRPDAPIIVFANQKGGVGKTTTAVNAAATIAATGHRVLLVDLDPQGNATSSLGVNKSDLETTIYDALLGDVPPVECVVPLVRPNLDLLPTTADLAAAEVDLAGTNDRELQLGRVLTPFRTDYDLILIDCPPALGLLTINALTAATHVVIPIQSEFLALEGMSQLITTIDLVRKQLNPALDLLGVLVTMYDSRTNLSANVEQEVRRFFPDRIFDTVIPRSVRLAEAPSYGQSIVEYDSASRGGVAYRSFAVELMTRLGLR